MARGQGKQHNQRGGTYFPLTTFHRLIAHTRLTFIFTISGASGEATRVRAAQHKRAGTELSQSPRGRLCDLPKLVTVVHTSRYTRPASWSITPAKGAFPEDCYHDCLCIPWSTGPTLSNPGYTNLGYTRGRPTDPFFFIVPGGAVDARRRACRASGWRDAR